MVQNVEQDEENSLTPVLGSAIFFSWGNNGKTDHISIIESSDDSTIHTVEGNSKDKRNREVMA
jgi:hypothetical protein